MSVPDRPAPHPDVAGYVLGVLDPAESEDFAHHLRRCEDCARELSELASLRVLLDRGMPAPVLPSGLAERTFAAVESAAAEGDRSPARPRGRPRLRAAAVAAMAGAAGVAALVAGLLLTGRTPAPAREIPLVTASGLPADALVRLHREDTGVVVELAVADLPVAPEGSFYECWYVALDDSPDRPARLTAGTFTVAAEGTTTVHMITAASHRRYPRIEVTLEPDDGDPRSTGPVVLRSKPAAAPPD